MGSKLDRASRGLFTKSNYLRDSEENEFIREKLLHEDYQKRLSDKENLRLRNNIELWATQCRKEWHRYGRRNPVKIDVNDPETHCGLCNQKLSNQKFLVKNEYTDEKLWIGSDCYKHIINSMESSLGINYTQEQARRFETFNESNTQITSFVNDKLSDKSKYILPRDIIENENKVIATIRRYIRRNVIKGNESDSKLKKIYSDIRKVYLRIDNFNNNANSVKNLLRKWADRIINLQVNGNAIVNDVSDNDGIINKNIAQRIELRDFLFQYVNQVNLKWNDISLNAIDNGKITITFIFEGKRFVIGVPSYEIINKLGYPMNISDLNNSQVFFNVLTYKVDVSFDGLETKNNLQYIALKAFDDSKYRRYQISLSDLKRYISKKEEKISDKTNISKKRFDNKIKESVFYQTGDYYLKLSANDLERVGMWVLENREYNVPNDLLEQMVTISNEEILNEFYKDMQFVGI